MVYVPEKFGSKSPIGARINAAEKPVEVKTDSEDRLLLFTTATCPKCRMAKAFLDKANVSYDTVLAEESEDLVKLYGIKEAPTLVVIEGGSVEKIANPSNIKAFCESVHAIV